MDAGCGGAGRRKKPEEGEADRSPVRTPGWAPAAGQRSVSSGAVSHKSAPRGAPRAPSRSSSGSPRTTGSPGPGAQARGRRAASVSDLADSPREQQRDRDEEEGESRLPPAAPCRHVRANATAGGAAARRMCSARPGRRPGPGPRAPLPGLQAAPLRPPPPPGPARLRRGRHVGRSPPRPLRCFLRRGPPRAAMGKSRQRARGPGPRAGLLVARAPCGNWESLGARRSSLEFSPSLPGRVEVALNLRQFPLPTAQTWVQPQDHPRPPPVASPPPRGVGSPGELAQRTRRARSSQMSPPPWCSSQFKLLWAPNYRCSN